MKTARFGSIIVGVVAALSLAAGTAHARPADDYGYGGHDDTAAVLPANFGDRDLGTWGGDDDEGRDRVRRPMATPLATLEQTCTRRGCVLRVLITDRDRTWSCRPVVRPTTRDRDDADWGLDGRSSLQRSAWGDRFGEDDEVARPRTLRTRLLCVLLSR